jgi:hypothetical protein
MKTHGKYESAARTTHRTFMSVVVLAMPLFAAGVSRAQSGSVPVSTARPARADSAMPVGAANSAAAPATSPASPEEKPAAKSPQEGIKVHGHWTIEVRNPDGSVQKHVEFENSIVATNLADMPGGPAFLYALLSGTGSFAQPPSSELTGNTYAGGWAINLQAPSGKTPPCMFTQIIIAADSGATLDSSIGPSCFVTSIPSECTFSGLPIPDCTPGLNVVMGTSSSQFTVDSAPNSSPGFGYPTPLSFSLAGTVTASQTVGSIGNVQTIVFINMPQTVLKYPSLAPFLFTSHVISPVTVTQGQSVAVTVTFSFS